MHSNDAVLYMLKVLCFSTGALNFEIRINHLSHTHSLYFEKKAEVAFDHGSYITHTFLQRRR